VWLKDRKLKTTDDITDSTLLSPDGHNLNRWKKELRISASIGNAPAFSLARGGADLEVAKAHQAWRYGIRMNADKEKELVEWLEKIYNWIEEVI
jgi:nitroreductase